MVAAVSCEHWLPIKPESELQDPRGAWGALEPERESGWEVMGSGLLLQAQLGLPSGLALAPFLASGLPEQQDFTCYCSAIPIWPGGCPTCPLTHGPGLPPGSTLDLLLQQDPGIPGRDQIPGPPFSGCVTSGKFLILSVPLCFPL